MTRTRQDFAQDIATELGIPITEARHIVDIFVSSMEGFLLRGDNIIFRGIASIKVVERKPKIGTNPRDPSAGFYEIPARKVVKFTTGTRLHEKLNPEQ